MEAIIFETAEKLVTSPEEVTLEDIFTIQSYILETVLAGLIGDKYDERKLQESEEKFVDYLANVYEAFFENLMDKTTGKIELDISETKTFAKNIYAKKPLIESGKENIYSIGYNYVSEIVEFLNKNGYIKELIEFASKNPEIRDLYLIENENNLDKASKMIAEASTLAGIIFLENLGAPKFKMVLEACKRKKKDKESKGEDKTKEEKMIESVMKKLIPVVKLVEEVKITF